MKKLEIIIYILNRLDNVKKLINSLADRNKDAVYMIERNGNCTKKSIRNAIETSGNKAKKIENLSVSLQNKSNQIKFRSEAVVKSENVHSSQKGENMSVINTLNRNEVEERRKNDGIFHNAKQKPMINDNEEIERGNNQSNIKLEMNKDKKNRENVPRMPRAKDVPEITQKVILVVDDSQTVRNIMALILNRAGYRSIRVASAMEALHTLTELIPDLIFLDVTLPGMDGLDICKIIKENQRTKQVPVVMLSGNGEVFDKVMARLAGASDYITKPFEPESIIGCINKFCGEKNRLREGLWQRTR